MKTNNNYSQSVFDRIEEKCRKAKQEIDKSSKKTITKTKWHNNITTYSINTSKVSRSPQID